MINCLLILTFCLCFAVSCVGQSLGMIEKKLSVVQSNKTVSQLVILPISLENKLTKLQVMLDDNEHYGNRIYISEKSLNNIRLLRVAEYVKFLGKQITENGLTRISSISHREWYPCIQSEGKMYVFTESDVEVDTQIFNLFLQDVKLKIGNEKQVKELVDLYFAATRGYFENKGKLILSNIEDVSLSYRKNKENETKRLKEIVNSLKIKMIGGSYQVELYTWEIGLGEVKRWNFIIQSDAQIKVQNEIVGKL